MTRYFSKWRIRSKLVVIVSSSTESGPCYYYFPCVVFLFMRMVRYHSIPPRYSVHAPIYRIHRSTDGLHPLFLFLQILRTSIQYELFSATTGLSSYLVVNWVSLRILGTKYCAVRILFCWWALSAQLIGRPSPTARPPATAPPHITTHHHQQDQQPATSNHVDLILVLVLFFCFCFSSSFLSFFLSTPSSTSQSSPPRLPRLTGARRSLPPVCSSLPSSFCPILRSPLPLSLPLPLLLPLLPVRRAARRQYEKRRSHGWSSRLASAAPQHPRPPRPRPPLVST